MMYTTIRIAVKTTTLIITRTNSQPVSIPFNKYIVYRLFYKPKSGPANHLKVTNTNTTITTIIIPFVSALTGPCFSRSSGESFASFALLARIASTASTTKTSTTTSANTVNTVEILLQGSISIALTFQVTYKLLHLLHILHPCTHFKLTIDIY